MVLLGFLALWEVAVRGLRIQPFILPPPSKVVVELVWGFVFRDYLEHTLYTLAEILLGFALGAGVGFVLGVWVSLSRLAYRILYPYIVFFQTMPKTAVAPLFILWLGFGMTPKVVIAALIAMFPMLVNTVVGLQTIEPERIELLRVHSGTSWQIFRLVQLPAALPFIFAGLDMAIVFSVIGAIVGEFISSQKGLGNLIIRLDFTLESAGMFAIIILLSLLGYLLHVVVVTIQRRVVFWAETQRVTAA
jgi:NitT/TauT family transport system permease protein